MNYPHLHRKKEYLPPAFTFLVFVILAMLIALFLFTRKAHAETTLKASWYSIQSLKQEGTYKYSKGVMANGKVFNESNLTCATRLFNLGTWLHITNLSNGRSVTVKVTDRIGKRFAQTRIDLSKGAFMQIADLKQGTVPITVERVK